MLTRFKEYNATGTPTDGRLYAGDLLLFQDLVAAASDFAQTIDVAFLRVGSSDLQIQKYGTGEFRFTGKGRFDGLVRLLGGLISGTFTTSQRNAIATGAGLAPYGTIILNTTTNQYEWNKGDDTTRDWQAMSPITSLASVIPYSVIDAKGDLIGGTGADALARLAVGTDGYRLGADSSQATGLKWNLSDFPIGAVCDWPWISTQLGSNYLLCYGQAVSRATYVALAAIAAASSYPHGIGDGSTTFNLPDYRGRSGVGKDNMGGSAANRVTVAASAIAGDTVGGVGGAQTVTLTTAEIPAHQHAIADPGHAHTIVDPQHSHNIARDFVEGSPVAHLAGQDGLTNDHTAVTDPASTGISMTAELTGISATNNTGGGTAHLNMPPSIIVNKVMRAL